MSKLWITVTDENGNDSDALTTSGSPDGVSTAWVFFEEKTGFGNGAGEFKFVRGLKRLPNGKYGA